MNVVNSEEQKWWMITQSFDHFFLFLSYLVLLYLWNSNKAMDGLFNFPFFILLLSADLYFWSRWTLFPFSPDLINFERQSVFLKWTSRADSAALVICLRQRRLLSCWELNNLGQPTNYISECLEQSYKIVTWEHLTCIHPTVVVLMITAVHRRLQQKIPYFVWCLWCLCYLSSNTHQVRLMRPQN